MLTDIEQALVDHVVRGQMLDLAGDEAINEAAMRLWDDSRNIRAGVLRGILRRQCPPDPDPHGLQLRGARIVGRLDLENITSDVALKLYDCLLDGGLVARDAHLSALVLTGCKLEHPSKPPLDAGRLTAPVVDLNRASIMSCCEAGAVVLGGAHLGRLDCDHATMRNDSGPALNADRLQVDNSLFLRHGFEAVASSRHGAVRLPGARIGGRLNCERAIIRNDSGPALHAERLQAQDVLLRDGFEAVGAGKVGAVRLFGAHLGGLECDGATVRNDSGPALNAERLLVDQSLVLRHGFEAVGTDRFGAVILAGARIGGVLDCDGATMRNDSGPALHADRLQVDHDVFLRDRFEAVGAGVPGAVRLAGARIGGRLNCNGATMRNDSGPALHADGLQVGQHVFLRDGFEAVASSQDGAIRLLGARIGGVLECERAIMRNDSGPALHADGLQVGLHVFLRGRFTALGDGGLGAVVLAGARVGGVLDCDGAIMRNGSGPALRANRLQVDQSLSLRGGFTAVGAGGGVALDLSAVRIGGQLAFDPAQLEHATDTHARLYLDGLVYSGLPEGISSRIWLQLLRSGTPTYAAQPYQQLAAVHRAAGHDQEARRILMAQRQDQIHRRALTDRTERAWARLTGVTLGYGYQPWRALVALLAAVATSVILALALGGHGGLTRTHPPTAAATSCSAVDRAGVGLDLGLPLLKTGSRSYCDTTHSATGQVLTVADWGLQLLAWAFATLFIAGFTGAIRKT